MAQYFGEMIRRVSDSTIIPFVTKDYADRINELYPALNTTVRSQLEAEGLAGSLGLYPLSFIDTEFKRLQWNISLYLLLPDYLKAAIDRFVTAAEQFDKNIKSIDMSR